MLRKIRTVSAVLFLIGVTFLFLDFTGTVHAWLGWMAKIQFLPALLALNVAVVVGLLLLTLLFGRVYCSVICPLGGLQDVISRLRGRKGKYRFSYSPAISWLRYAMLGLFVGLLVAGLTSFAALLAPYSSYGRMVQSLLSPIYTGINNLLAFFAERTDSYMFYHQEVWVRSAWVMGVALVTLAVIVVLALRNGRTYCNTLCPVGTVLGFFSRFSLFKPVIDSTKCNACGLCAKGCKAACIDSKKHKIDYSRCVTCFDCIDTCRHGAINYVLPSKRCSTRTTDEVVREQAGADGCVAENSTEGIGRRGFMVSGLALATAAVANAREKTVDGGLAVILDKKIPKRATPIVPPGAKGLKHLRQHCTGCQLCVAACPNGVLRPSDAMDSMLQPEASYERGYCRPECTRCSDVCPAGAIHKVSVEDKSSIQVGHAVWIKENCVPLTDGVSCGNCARHCPTGAITMVDADSADADSPRIPVVNEERCIGCGACENLCPARPFSAIYVEGHQIHRII